MKRPDISTITTVLERADELAEAQEDLQSHVSTLLDSIPALVDYIEYLEERDAVPKHVESETTDEMDGYGKYADPERCDT
jgi:cytochrome c